MAETIKCDYIHTNEYRKFVQLLAEENLSLSQGYWWVEKENNGPVGTVYNLYCNEEYCGYVRRDDLGKNNLEEFLWRLMKYVEGYVRNSNWSIMVFPKNFSGTSWETRSGEFVAIGGAGAKREWFLFYRKELHR